MKDEAQFPFRILIVFLLVVLPASTDAIGPRRIQILAIGATMPQMTQVVPWFTIEPSTSVSHVPTRGFGLHMTPVQYERAIRIYLPRTYEDMLYYDAFVYVGGSVNYISPRQVSYLRRAVEEGGRGAFGDLGGVSVTAEIVDIWITSGIWELFPSDAPGAVDSGLWGHAEVPYTVEVLEGRDNNPLEPFQTLDIEKVTGSYGRLIIPREGSTIYALIEGLRFKGNENPPFLVAWDYADGRTMLVAEFFNHRWFQSPPEGQNSYVVDIVVNMVLNTIGRPVHQDIPLLHLARERARDFHNYYTMLLSTLDFVERFGANTVSFVSDLRELEGLAGEAEKQVLNGDLEDSIDTWDQCIEEAKAAGDRAMELRDKAMLWTYLIEWFAVLGTSMICGIVLHAVMIRRKFYRQATTTRLEGNHP